MKSALMTAGVEGEEWAYSGTDDTLEKTVQAQWLQEITNKVKHSSKEEAYSPDNLSEGF
jgi:hypothetical protein